MQISSCYISLVDWVMFPEPITHSEIASDEFAFLHPRKRKASFPAVSPFKITPISRYHLQSDGAHDGITRLWDCLKPYYPYQAAPGFKVTLQLPPTVPVAPSLFSGKLKIYLHPFGLVSVFEMHLQYSEPISPGKLVSFLQAIESEKCLVFDTTFFGTKKNLRDVFRKTRNHFCNHIWPESAPREPALRPACVAVLLEGDIPPTTQELLRSPEDQRGIFYILQRKTSNRDPDWEEFNRKRYIQLGRESGTGARSGWTFCCNEGLAAYLSPGRSNEHSQRAAFCHHQNLAKLLGFYRLYHAFLGYTNRSQPLPVDVLTHAVNALDLMRIRYSNWWIRWASTRPEFNIEDWLGELVEYHNINRKYPPYKWARKTQGPNTVINKKIIYMRDQFGGDKVERDKIGRDKVEGGQQNIVNSVINGQAALKIDRSNAIVGQQATSDKKAILEQLQKEVREIIAALPDSEQETTADMLTSLVTQATAEKPNRKWYSVSAEGLIDASKQVKEITSNVAGTVGQLGKLIWPDFSIGKKAE
jgi:hypothetical protein